MGNENDEEYSVEQFILSDSNFSQIVELVKDSFLKNSEDEGGTISFTEETFNIMFGSPYMPRDLNVCVIYKPTGKIVGFTGGLPRNISYKGNVYKFGVPGFQAVHWEHQRKGLAVKMGIKMLEVARGMGYQGGFATYEPEAYGINAMLKVVEDTGLKMIKALDMRKFIIRVFDIGKVSKLIKLKWFEKLGLRLIQSVKKTNNPKVRKYKEQDAERLFELMQDHIEKNQISIIREHDDFIWYLNQPGINCVVHEDENGTIDGFVLAWAMNLAGFGKELPFGWLDLVHTYRLNMKDATDLCNYLCQTSKERGWYGLQSPFLPYFDPLPFKKAKFIFFPKDLLLRIFCIQDVDLPDKVESFYFDWR